MKIYKNHQLIKNYPLFMWRYGSRFFLFLDGLHLHMGNISPVYNCLLYFYRHNFGFNIETPWIRFIFLSVPPFFTIELPEGEYLMKAENNDEQEE